MTNKNSKILHIKWIVLLTLQAITVLSQAQCCIQFNINECIGCPSGMHLYRSNCIYDIQGCLQYLSGFDCLTCRTNYQLQNGECIHQRFSTAITKDSNFVVYLQSTLKPDSMLKIGREKLQRQRMMWIDWYNNSLILNKTYLNKKSLVRNALKLMNLTVKATPQYIFTSSIEKGNTSLLFYRFTYQISFFGGFVDCLVVVETINGQQNYIQLNQAKFNLLSNQTGWLQVKTGSKDETYILSRMKSVFSKCANESHLKGYSRVIDGGVNFTMFFINYKEGVVPYIYIADTEEVPSLNDIKNVTTITIPTNTTSNKQISIDNSKKQQNNQTKITNQQSSKQFLNTTKDNINNQSSICSSCNEVVTNISNAQNNPIYVIGIAVIKQQYRISASTIQQIFYINTTPLTYGFYLNSASTYYRFTFRITQSTNQFQVLNYTQSNQPFIKINNSTTNNPANTTKTNSQANKNNEVPPQQINIVPNQTSCNNVHFSNQFTDITNKQNSDIFLPRINLLLKTVYSTLLQNSHISLAKFNLGLNSISLSNITYQITYQNLQKKLFYFEVAIIDNQFNIIKSPQISNVTTTPTNNNNKTNVDNTNYNPTNQSTVTNKTNTTQTNQSTPNPKQNQQTSIITNQTKPNQQHISNKTTLIQQAKTINKAIPATKDPQTNITISESKQQKQTPKKINNTNNTSTNQSTPNKTVAPIQIPYKNYTTQPKYKSLITIVKSLYRIPTNATVVSMHELQNVGGDARYRVMFKMDYKNQLPDGTVSKVSTYNLTINPSSFVSVKDQKIQFIKADLPSNTAANKSSQILAVPSPNKTLELPAPLQPIPSYQKSLFTIFNSHSSGLNRFKMLSLSSELITQKYGGLVKVFRQKIQFIDQRQAICFDVVYSLISQGKEKQNQELVNIAKYQCVQCPQQQQRQLNRTQFKNWTILQRSINQQIIKINKNSPLTINLFQKWSSFYQVRFNSLYYGKKQIVIDSSNSITIVYKTLPQLVYSQKIKNNTLIQPKIAQILRSKMEKILKLSNGSLSLGFIKKINQNKQVQLLDVYAKTKIKSIWSQQIYEYFKMEVKYWPDESFSKLMSVQVFDLSNNQYSLNMTNKNWMQVSTRQTFTQHLFSSIIFSLRQAYFGFLQNSELIAIYRDNPVGNVGLKQYITDAEGARFYIAILKKFASFGYQSAYLITVRYRFASNSSIIQNLQNLQLSAIVSKQCQSSIGDDLNHLPKCKKCKDNYRLVQNFCIPQIKGCVQYMDTYCIKCQNNLMASQDMLQCLSQADPGQKSQVDKSINHYLWAINH